jgi:hypothetical protein
MKKLARMTKRLKNGIIGKFNLNRHPLHFPLQSPAPGLGGKGGKGDSIPNRSKSWGIGIVCPYLPCGHEPR